MILILTCCLIWICGWAAGSRIALTHRMNRTVCTGQHRNGQPTGYATVRGDCHEYHTANCQQPLGETRDRTVTDGLAAAAIGLTWPALIFARTIVGITPRTPAETRRILRQQAADIKHLQSHIAATPAARPPGTTIDFHPGYRHDR